jgi:hypothetical protein
MAGRQAWSQRYRFVGPESCESFLISMRTEVRDERTKISYYVQPRTMNSTSNIGTGTPIAHSRIQPIAPVSFCMIFDKIFIIPS